MTAPTCYPFLLIDPWVLGTVVSLMMHLALSALNLQKPCLPPPLLNSRLFFCSESTICLNPLGWLSLNQGHDFSSFVLFSQPTFSFGFL